MQGPYSLELNFNKNSKIGEHIFSHKSATTDRSLTICSQVWSRWSDIVVSAVYGSSVKSNFGDIGEERLCVDGVLDECCAV